MSMAFKTIAGHTFDESLLTDGVIIDVGCRGFEFANYFNNKIVYCIDPDPNVFDGKTAINVVNHNDEGRVYLNVAIFDKSGESGIYINGEGTCLKEIDPDQSHPFIPCKTITMEELYNFTGENVDLLKLDCEGAEYIILGETFKPIAKQISVEMHRHCVPELHDREYPKIIERLSRYYVIANNPAYERRHGCSENFWDVLFIRKW